MQYIHLIYPYQWFSSLISHAFVLSHLVVSSFLQSFWTVACQAPLSMGIFRWEYWSGLPFPLPGDLLNPGIKSRSPASEVNYLPAEPSGKPSSFVSLICLWPSWIYLSLTTSLAPSVCLMIILNVNHVRYHLSFNRQEQLRYMYLQKSSSHWFQWVYNVYLHFQSDITNILNKLIFNQSKVRYNENLYFSASYPQSWSHSSEETNCKL